MYLIYAFSSDAITVMCTGERNLVLGIAIPPILIPLIDIVTRRAIWGRIKSARVLLWKLLLIILYRWVSSGFSIRIILSAISGVRVNDFGIKSKGKVVINELWLCWTIVLLWIGAQYWSDVAGTGCMMTSVIVLIVGSITVARWGVYVMTICEHIAPSYVVSSFRQLDF